MSNRRSFSTRLVLALEQRLLGDALATAFTDAGFDVNVTDRRDLSMLDECEPGRAVVLDVTSLDELDVLLDLTSMARVLVLAPHVDDEMVAGVLARGGSGVISLDASLEEIRQAIVAVNKGATAVRGVALKQLIRGAPPRSGSNRHRAGRLTARETSILARLARGASTRDIAVEMGITTNTARTHIQNILGKLDVHSRLEASAVAAREGII